MDGFKPYRSAYKIRESRDELDEGEGISPGLRGTWVSMPIFFIVGDMSDILPLYPLDLDAVGRGLNSLIFTACA